MDKDKEYKKLKNYDMEILLRLIFSIMTDEQLEKLDKMLSNIKEK